MKTFDLTHPISAGMPVFPGTAPPRITTACTVEEHGFLEKEINMYSHTGTHIDAPAHLLAGAATLDKLPVDTYLGRALIYRHLSPDKKITVAHLQPLSDRLRFADFLLVATSWDRYWGQEQYFADFPVLHQATARWLLQFPLKGIGLDVISADTVDAKELQVHRTLLGAGMVIIENLKGLTAIPGDSCTFYCFPLYLPEADGSPVRAVATVG